MLSKAHQEAWAALFEAQRTVVLQVERELAAAGLPPLAWYDLLYTLYREPGHRVRMHEIADQVLMSRSGLTRLADRVEQAGLIARRQCAVDRRGLELELLPAGREMLRRLWAVYGDVVARSFAPHVNRPELLTEQLRPVIEAHHTAPSPSGDA